MIRLLLPVPLLLAVLTALGPNCQTGPSGQQGQSASRPASQPGTQPALAQLVDQLKEKGVTLDVAAGTVAFDAEVLVTNDFLEYLLIGRTGKSHEALFRTQIKASTLKAGLMALGFQDGKNASYKEKDPQPTEEEIRKGVDPVEVIPPKGMRVYIYAEWKGDKGEPVRYRAEDLWIDVRSEQKIAGIQWIFFGGRMATIYRGEPPMFVADLEENLISTCYMLPDNHLITAEHKDARDDKSWWPNAKVLPARGTPVRLILSREPLEKSDKR
jgi:hypothetical protein